VAEAKPGCLLLCGDTVSTSNQLAFAFGLGVRVNVGSAAVATLEGRFLQVPGSDIQALEAVANASIALGKLHTESLLAGTLGPAVSAFIPISGPLRGRGPFAGVRFRRDTKKAGTLGLEIDFAPLEVTAGSCTPGCRPNAILFAPGFEASARPRGAGSMLRSARCWPGSTRRGPTVAWPRGCTAASVPISTAAW